MTRFVAAFVALLSLWSGVPAQAQNLPSEGRSANVEARLMSERTTAAPGETFHIVLEQKIARGWHTYWRNPGDSGEPTDIAWTLPEGVTASPIKWPAPSAIPFGPLVNYGFSDTVRLPVAITVPATATAGSALSLVADITWLECSDICIPGGVKLGLGVNVGAASVNTQDAGAVQSALTALPTAFKGTTILTDLGAGGLQLVVKGSDTPRDAYFFPYEVANGALIDFAQPQELVRGEDGFGLSLVKSPSYPADLTGDIGGVLVLGKGGNAQAFEVTAPLSTQAAGFAPSPSQAPSIGLIAAIGLAFLGGLLLNVMPCVFPILSMKILGLVQTAHTPAHARAHGLWYGAGVIASFLALAGVLIGFQSAGAAVGWGFQLQNPVVVICLAVIMTLVGFNLLGFFEFGSSLQNIGGSARIGAGPQGSALTGVLAVVVAAPCTAPFMGAALGFAATQSAGVALLVFSALGLGFALPFVALSFAPKLLAALPKPGPWMLRFKEALAFPMFATAIWLIWVVSAQAGQAGVLGALVAILSAGLSVWIARQWPGKFGKTIAAIGLVGGLLGAGLYVSRAVPSEEALAQAPQFGEKWSPERVTQLQREGKTVFVNFTADWCVSCKVNEINVFSNPDVRAALTSGEAVYLVADWTTWSINPIRKARSYCRKF
jgi:DsbC/DsbD-like thiol-disulfide interchange protein/cytochrome c biogenesis protein CcdA